MDAPATLCERLEDPTSILLLAPSLEEPDNRACIDLLSPRHPQQENVLSITVSETPDDRLAVWQHHIGDTLPKRAAIVDAGRSTTEDQLAASDEFPSITVDVLSDPSNLYELGMAISQYLESWETTSEQTRVCLHSITPLLGTHDQSTVHRLITALNARLTTMDAVAHYHLDPDAHDEQVIADLRPLFDTVIEHDIDGDWTVRRAAADEEPPLYQRDRSESERPDRAHSSGRETTAVDYPSLPYSFDTIIDLLSARLRRYVLYELVEKTGAQSSLDTIVDGVYEREAAYPGRETSPSRAEIETALVHSHLPRLEEAGIVGFDRSERTVVYRTIPGIEPCIEHARAIEGQR